jgi:hypothetical protein
VLVYHRVEVLLVANEAEHLRGIVARQLPEQRRAHVGVEFRRMVGLLAALQQRRPDCELKANVDDVL